MRAGRAPRAGRRGGRASDAAGGRRDGSGDRESASEQGRSSGYRAGCAPHPYPRRRRAEDRKVPAGSPRSPLASSVIICSATGMRAAGDAALQWLRVAEASLTGTWASCPRAVASWPLGQLGVRFCGREGDGERTNLLMQPLACSGGCQRGETKLKEMGANLTRVTWIAPFLVSGKGMAGDPGRSVFCHTLSLETVRASIISICRRVLTADEKVVHLSEDCRRSCWRMTRLLVLCHFFFPC